MHGKKERRVVRGVSNGERVAQLDTARHGEAPAKIAAITAAHTYTHTHTPIANEEKQTWCVL